MSTVIEKIRRLRALAASTSFPAEAESANAKADELMAKHGISEGGLVEPPPRPSPFAPPAGSVVMTWTVNSPWGGNTAYDVYSAPFTGGLDDDAARYFYASMAEVRAKLRAEQDVTKWAQWFETGVGRKPTEEELGDARAFAYDHHGVKAVHRETG